MNLPNKLSVFRILIVPVITLLFLLPEGVIPTEVQFINFAGIELNLIYIIGLLLFVIASITDFIDGYIARKHNMITSFGKFIDPIADKLLVNTMLLLLANAKVILLAPVLIMIWRDILVDGMRMMAAKNQQVVAARNSGKLKTVVQMITVIIATISGMALSFNGLSVVSNVLVWTSAAISVYSGVEYFIQTKKFIMESK